jgi:hypothetical protein
MISFNGKPKATAAANNSVAFGLPLNQELAEPRLPTPKGRGFKD